jgi:hypothetical protein
LPLNSNVFLFSGCAEGEKDDINWDPATNAAEPVTKFLIAVRREDFSDMGASFKKKKYTKSYHAKLPNRINGFYPS